ncbi:hypothetical protein DC522_09205 [Microvirga sp. KLBC 81]|uniref:hypothetical protein n=1 Tax=Microvirga sp. KLBC 81 TaxID=1862707 RepID=UPI000D5155B7|nr:hypothetical protein [Microvirga sp. KLBC 81]PVE24781.1 hypothetical protein DC522_09205 [Microvirga sp. KLBC 81]
MKAFLASVMLAALSTGAMAQSAATTLTMTCQQARQIVASQGAVVLRTGPTTYDRYVRDPSFCGRSMTVQPAWIRAADTAQCPVGGICRSIEIDNGQ